MRVPYNVHVVGRDEELRGHVNREKKNKDNPVNGLTPVPPPSQWLKNGQKRFPLPDSNVKSPLPSFTNMSVIRHFFSLNWHDPWSGCSFWRTRYCAYLLIVQAFIKFYWVGFSTPPLFRPWFSSQVYPPHRRGAQNFIHPCLIHFWRKAASLKCGSETW